MYFDPEPVEHILSHLVRGKSSEPLVAFDVSNKGDHPHDNRLLLVTSRYRHFLGLISRSGQRSD